MDFDNGDGLVLWVHKGMRIMGERSMEGWRGRVVTRISFSLNSDSGDGSVLWVYWGVHMMGERSMGG